MSRKVVEFLLGFLQDWKYPAKISLLIVTIILSVGLGYALDIHRMQDELFVQIKASEAAKIQVVQINKLIADEQQVSLLAGKYAKFSNFSELLNIFSVAARRLQVTIFRLKPALTSCDEKFCVFSVKLELIGEYDKLVKFLLAVLELPYLLALPDFTFEMPNNDLGRDVTAGLSQKTLQLDLLVYNNNFVWKELLPPTRGIVRQEGVTAKNTYDENRLKGVNNLRGTGRQFRDLFVLDANLSAKNNLTSWAVADLRLLGCIENADGVQGVVQDPVGNIYTVGVGMMLGEKSSRIVSVSCDAIILDNGREIRL